LATILPIIARSHAEGNGNTLRNGIGATALAIFIGIAAAAVLANLIDAAVGIPNWLASAVSAGVGVTAGILAFHRLVGRSVSDRT
jgi:hypothetical protein